MPRITSNVPTLLPPPDPVNPASYPRRVLLCVLGLSPQVVTETLYALAVQESVPFVPNEVHVVTTTQGAQAVRDGLLPTVDKAPKGGPLFELFSERGLGSIYFGDDHIHVICRDDAPLADIDSDEDATATSNAILSVVRDLALDDNCAIHASIAGGRKTMGVSLGQVMVLLGRKQDRMSHVLVNAPFELLRDFYYPPISPVWLQRSYREGQAADGERFNTADAKITLARVPLIRVSDGLGARLLLGNTDFEELVALAQLELLRPTVLVRPGSLEVSVGDKTCTFRPLEMFWYLLLLRKRQAGTADSGIKQPGAIRFKSGRAAVMGVDATIIAAVNQRVPDNGVRPLETTAAQFRSVVSEINTKLTNVFGPALAARARLVGPQERGKRDGEYGLFNVEPEGLKVA